MAAMLETPSPLAVEQDVNESTVDCDEDDDEDEEASSSSEERVDLSASDPSSAFDDASNSSSPALVLLFRCLVTKCPQ